MAPIKACELDDGSPRYQVPRFQRIAEISRAKTIAKPVDEPMFTTTFGWAISRSRYDSLSAAQRMVIDRHCTSEWAEKVATPFADFEEAGRPKLAAEAGHEAYKLTQPFSPHKSAAIDRITIDPGHLILPAITNNLVLDLAYVGNHGVKELDKVNLNQPFLGAGWTPAAIATCNSTGIAANCGQNPSTALGTTLRPYGAKFPWMGDITAMGNDDTSRYNGLQVTVTARNFHGLYLVSGYTWSHSFSFADANNGGPNDRPRLTLRHHARDDLLARIRRIIPPADAIDSPGLTR